MKRQPVLTVATECVERGWIPDSIIRWGIRRLCSQRLTEQAGAVQEGGLATSLERFINQLRDTDIAPVAFKANEQHYEVPAEFFKIMLGPHLKYSACWWNNDAEALETAEGNALRLSASQAMVSDGMNILELGCGWGSLTLWLARQYPHSHITALSNSVSQRTFIEDRAQEYGLSNITVITADMNTFSTQKRFDRIISIEMFEHMRNYHMLLSNIRKWLTPNGQLYVHIFCHKKFAYPFETEGADNWLGRHFFSGGLMPSADLLTLIPSPFEVKKCWMWSGIHYQRTAEAWLKNLDDKRAEVYQIFARTYGPASAKRWLQRWRVFLMACAELFGYNGGTEWMVAHYRFSQKDNYVNESSLGASH